ncbi:hypothetical protein DVH05_003333 [Phytophthora capsici]|nr:hypothetical protein DVH05_003333 [Phytophthora capsici]
MAGWEVNYGFWVRVAIIGSALGSLFSNLISPWLDVPPLSQRQHITFCLGCGAGMVLTGMLTAEVWAFPVPFFIISVFVPMAWVFILLLCAVMGREAVRRILSRHEQLRRLNNVSLLINLMCVGYPAFQVLFNHVSRTSLELPVLLLLPVLKVLLKRLFAHLASHKWDIVAGEMIFTVDFFDALYLTTFIPNLTFVSLVAIVTIDLIQAGADLVELYHRTRVILQRLREAVDIPDNTDDPNLLAVVRLLALQNENISGIRVRSCVSYPLPAVDRVLLEQLEGPSFQHSSTVRVAPKLPELKQPRVDEIVSDSSRKLRSSVVDNSGALQEALEVLFTSEILILTEYLEVIVPVLYGTFVLAMVHLPSAQYHTEMEGVTRENVYSTVSRMFIYAFLELLSFLLLVGVVKRNCCIDAVYQLAFVLETHRQLILSRLILWMISTLAYRVAHFGMPEGLMLLQVLRC